jgi:glycine/D-amino acid oxidase-like deaminating enzyme
MTVVVLGAGVFGAWCALRLADAGHKVRLFDAYGPASGRASSADHSRVIRAGYGPDAIYSEWAAASLEEWRRLERDANERLLTLTGALFLGPPGHAYIDDTFHTLTHLAHPVERLAPADLARRFPQISLEGLGPAVLEHGAGALRARVAVQACVRVAVEKYGVEFQVARVMPLDEQRSSALVRLLDGTAIDADAFVVAGGPWLPQLLPVAIGGRIRVTRQEVLYFGVPQADTRFAAANLPVWIDFAAGLYGIPDLDCAGFKVGIDRHGDAIDPDSADRLVDPAIVASTRTWLQARFPAIGPAPLVDARVCQYENSSTGDFIIDQHPQWSNVWIVGGGSGHGFKHGPAVGRHLAARIAGAPPIDRFTLATKSTVAARAVY